MRKYLVFNIQTGDILRTIETPYIKFLLENVTELEDYIENEIVEKDIHNYKIQNGKIVPKLVADFSFNIDKFYSQQIKNIELQAEKDIIALIPLYKQIYNLTRYAQLQNKKELSLVEQTELQNIIDIWRKIDDIMDIANDAIIKLKGNIIDKAKPDMNINLIKYI